MDKVFREQVGWNVEVYVDDILVKSKSRDCFIPDLKETFSTIRRYGIKLNPTKCMFGVKSGKFLGFMVTERGIEVNSEKVKLLQEMPSPTSIKEVQRLTGRITALARFIARSAHRSYPFFQVLCTAQRFGWTEQCEQAFQELKEHLASLSILVKPKLGERLWVYLSTTERAVITARKLRPYFLSHPVTVLTNSLLGRILTHPDASGRLVKWSVELGEYDIEYQPHKAIKAQALSDFLTEVATFGQEEVWRIFVDGASGVGGSGVGVIRVSPTQEKIKIAMRLDFQASNNEAEYEAVIAGMRQAWEVGQVKRTFCTREEKLIKYSKVIEELRASFITWSIEQIPREENMEADALAKRAVTGENGDKESLVQREMVAAIEAREPVIREDTWMIPLVKLYRRSYQGPLLKCLGEGETEYVLRLIHLRLPGLVKAVRGLVMCSIARQSRLHGMGKDWVEEIPSVLWAYRTTPHTATQESPFSLVYGSEAILPVEIGQPSARIRAYDDTDEGARAQKLDLIEERRKKAAHRMEAYRARVMRAYNQKVKPREFKEGEFVLKRVNPAGEVGKLDARWEGPYKLIRRVGANTWYLQDSQGRLLKRPWNALHLKKYFFY
ncbi:uncharacterized protein [Henckelia pumila]|uniref:uncharacterized protein n=1 Tax=Henckelia pumila TaxID=405737 RepID=UPI003C6E76FC